MIFERLRSQMKWIIVAVAVAFAVTLLYVGVPFFRSGSDAGQAEGAVAKVNKETIGSPSFQRAYLDQLRVFEQTRGSVRPTDIEEIKYAALDSLIAGRLLVQAARDEGVKVGRGEVDQRLSEIRDSFPSRTEYQRQLQLRNMTERDLRQAVEESLMQEKLQEKMGSRVQVTDEDVARAYEQVQARHILVKPDGTDEKAWQKAEAKAKALYQRLKQGADFAALAKQESDDDATRSKGGDLGFFGRGSMVDAFEQAAFALKKGEISTPVRSTFGYHVIQVTDRKEASGPEFEKAKADVAQQLRKDKAGEAFATWFSEYRAQADVTIFDPQMAARDALRRNDLETALKLYTQAATTSPEDAYLQYGAARALMGLNRPAEALASFKKAAELAPSDPVLQLELGNAYRQQGDKTHAAEAFRKASELAPMDLQVHVTLYALFTSLGLKEDAAKEQQDLEKIQKVMTEQQRLQDEFMKKLQEQQAPQGQPGASSSSEGEASGGTTSQAPSGGGQSSTPSSSAPSGR